MIGGKLLEENVFLSDTASPFLDSRYLNGLVTTFYTYLHPTPATITDNADESLADLAQDNAPETAPITSPSSDGGYHRDPDGDDYRHVSDMTAFSSKPGWKGKEQLEIEKVHRLAKKCLRAPNPPAACNEIVRLDAMTGKFYILRNSLPLEPALLRKLK